MKYSSDRNSNLIVGKLTGLDSSVFVCTTALVVMVVVGDSPVEEVAICSEVTATRLSVLVDRLILQ